jgi:hypothetical protein
MSRREQAHPLDGLPVSVLYEITRRLDPATRRHLRLVSRGCAALSSKGLCAPRRIQLALSAGAQGVPVTPAALRGVRDRFPLATTLVLTGHAFGAGVAAAAAAAAEAAEAAAELRAMAAEGTAWRGVERFEARGSAAALVCAALLGLLPDLKAATLSGKPQDVLPAAARCGGLEEVTLLLDAAPAAGGDDDGEGAAGAAPPAGPSVEELAALLGGLAGLKRWAPVRWGGAVALCFRNACRRIAGPAWPRVVGAAARLSPSAALCRAPRAACASPTPARRCETPCC